ncbi:RagB/SusD family nutrient uptake outer membrane protein [Flavobacterium sp. XGLA_31]|uniref:RagB/SusD family nutrient uptake outer membrane protein n=1 Tax=Flavobacterium sp. XGLA_31 TaxID=3447666 RepID=UPI003F330883
MKNLKYFRLIQLNMVVGLIVLFYGCDSFVDVDLPSSQLTSSSVFDEKATANAAMTDIYSKLRDSGLMTGTESGMSIALGIYTDELDYYGTSLADLQFFYNNSVLPANDAVAEWWSSSYNVIYSANTVYEGVNASTKLSQAAKDQLMGEALFVRGLVHFNLVNLFGNIPYVTTTSYEQNQVAHKMTVADVYNHVISDLEAAKVLLPVNYFGGQRIRPNKLAVSALLARVYLYNGNNGEAANEASAVINESGIYSLVTDFDTAFLKGSESTIWQFIPNSPGGNTAEGANLIFNAGPPSFAALTDEFVNAFEPGDLRKTHWVRAITDGSSVWYHSYKYKRQGMTGTTEECSIVMRLPEMYLIRAEARAKQGFLTGAKDDLDIIRSLAGLPDTTATTQQDLLAAILRERRVEFFTEGGHRFFDLKRASELTNVLGPVKPGWSSNEALFPLPQSELLLNPNMLPQNPGY